MSSVKTLLPSVFTTNINTKINMNEWPIFDFNWNTMHSKCKILQKYSFDQFLRFDYVCVDCAPRTAVDSINSKYVCGFLVNPQTMQNIQSIKELKEENWIGYIIVRVYCPTIKYLAYFTKKGFKKEDLSLVKDKKWNELITNCNFNKRGVFVDMEYHLDEDVVTYFGEKSKSQEQEQLLMILFPKYRSDQRAQKSTFLGRIAQAFYF